MSRTRTRPPTWRAFDELPSVEVVATRLKGSVLVDKAVCLRERDERLLGGVVRRRRQQVNCAYDGNRSRIGIADSVY